MFDLVKVVLDAVYLRAECAALTDNNTRLVRSGGHDVRIRIRCSDPHPAPSPSWGVKRTRWWSCEVVVIVPIDRLVVVSIDEPVAYRPPRLCRSTRLCSYRSNEAVVVLAAG